MPQCQFLIFCYFCVSEKLRRKYSRNWMKQKSNLLFLSRRVTKSEDETEGARGQAHPRAARPAPGPRHLGVRPPGPPPDAPLSPIYSLDGKNLRDGTPFAYILQAAAVVVARSGGSRSSSRHPAGEGNPCRRPSPPPWSPPE
jgi:hypothetical protein